MYKNFSIFFLEKIKAPRFLISILNVIFVAQKAIFT